MYGLTPDDLELQARARGFADELIPHEEYAEAHDGELPDGRRPPARGPRGRARADRHQHAHLGRAAAAAAAPAGPGPGAGRPGHQRPGLVPDHAAGLVARGRQRPPARHLRCSRRSRAGARSATRSPRSTPAPTSPTCRRPPRRDGDDYVLNGVKWHVTSYNKADYVLFQAVLTTGEHAGDQALFVADKDTPGHPRGPHPGVHPHHRPPPPGRGLRGRPRARDAPDRRRRTTGCRSSTSGSASSG